MQEVGRILLLIGFYGSFSPPPQYELRQQLVASIVLARRMHPDGIFNPEFAMDISDDGGDDSIESIQEDAAQEAEDRASASESLAEHDAERGAASDSKEQSDAARQDVDWDAASDHADEGGKFTK